MGEIRIGVIGTANTHAYQYIGLINGWRDDIPLPGRLADGRPSGLMYQAFGTHLREASRQHPESVFFDRARVTRLWSEESDAADLLEHACGVQIVDEPADVVKNVDAVMVLTEDPTLHELHSAPSLDAGLPTYIDKPLASDEDQAQSIAERARLAGAPWFSCSTLRFEPYLDPLCCSIERDYGGAQSVYVQAPLRADLYASHLVEVMAVIMKSLDVTNISALEAKSKDVAVVEFADGRSATLENVASVERMSFTAVIQSRLRQHVWVGRDFGLMNTNFLRAFINFIQAGQAPIPIDEVLRSFSVTCQIHRAINAS